jgi:hypothetical protein
MAYTQCSKFNGIPYRNLFLFLKFIPALINIYILYPFIFYISLFRSRVSSGSIVSDYGLDDRGSIPGRGKGFFLYPLCPDGLWGPPSLLYNGYRGSFPGGKSAAGA